MAPRTFNPCPFETNVFGRNDDHDPLSDLPASYHYHDRGKRKKRILATPAEDVQCFLETELSLERLDLILDHLWFAGAKHPATRLHLQLAMGRHLTVADRMDLHLLWDNSGRIFLKPLPTFLLRSKFWRDYLCCTEDCTCKFDDSKTRAFSPACSGYRRRVARGFLYTYVCLISSEIDFSTANEYRLLPRDQEDNIMKWSEWKQLVQEFLQTYNKDDVHPRFHRAELRLSRINTIGRLTSIPAFRPYFQEWHNYGSFFRDNLSWIAASTVFIALILTAMQLGLATERLQGNNSFQEASYGFTVFSILGPICALALVTLRALFILARDLPLFVKHKQAQPHETPVGEP